MSVIFGVSTFDIPGLLIEAHPQFWEPGFLHLLVQRKRTVCRFKPKVFMAPAARELGELVDLGTDEIGPWPESWKRFGVHRLSSLQIEFKKTKSR
jgi:hypothetical protein